MGAWTEFSDTRITAEHGSWRKMPLPLASGQALVTDDTQMTLALGEGLAEALSAGPLAAATMEPLVRARFVQWWASPDNDRAPGMTCLWACEALSRGGPWQAATEVGSKLCGANMRVAPVGLIPGLNQQQRSGAAQMQAALTHGHPIALAASDLTAHAIWLLEQRTAPAVRRAACMLREHARRVPRRLAGRPSRARPRPRPGLVHRPRLGRVPGRAGPRGAALVAADPEADPCLAVGEGWIAEEALATALYCFLLMPDDPQAVVRRAACSSGDSDSIAALAGALAGAHHGIGAWPERWVRDM